LNIETRHREDEATSQPLWWQTGTVYQIYPRSFQDSNGDGVGDLNGIRKRLDYLEGPGVDAVWLSPIYPSPMKDFGYDISDHTAIDPIFGTLDDFDRLLAEVHERGLKLILDFVPNHTSDRHGWFEESRSTRDNPKRDWYIWRDPAPDGGPPNNWLSNFGGSAWTFDEATGQYYYHAFLAEQPDLNWRNPDVRHAQYDVLRFWFDLGVDGFRIDVVWHVIKDDQFRDNPPNPDFQEGHHPYSRYSPIYVADRPDIHDVICELRDVADDYDQRLLIGEIYLPIERLVTYYGRDLRGLHLPFNFQLIEAEWNARGIERMIDQYERLLPKGGWPNWVLGNHDQRRIATRVGREQAPAAAVLLLALRGTPTLYYGDELGLADQHVPPERQQDPCGLIDPDIPSRDPARTPMRWDASEKAGFTDGEPWLPIGEDITDINVETERENPDSILNLYRRMLALRERHASLRIGRIRLIEAHGDLLVFARENIIDRLLVVINLGSQPHSLTLAPNRSKGRVLLCTEQAREGEELVPKLQIAPNEALIAELLDE
jgi:alpha-glucosidase